MSDTQSISPVLLLKDPLVGTRLGEYEVIEPIGEGGMGVVYRAVHPLIKKRVAIKVLKPGAATDAAHVKRLIAEAEAVNAIGHRNIVDIFGLGQLDDGRPYIVMEMLEGEALDAYLARSGRLPLHEVLTLLLDISAPLAAAHGKGVIHRDLKPSNVFLCREADGGHYVKLLDFGLAKKAMGLDGSSAQTSQHIVAGTPDYMAPEQARAMPVSARTDIYAFGVMAFELLTGEVPFTGLTPMDVMMAHVGAPAPPVSRVLPTVPPALDALVQRLMSKDPQARPASMADVRGELKKILASLDASGMYQRLETVPDRPSISMETPAVREKVTVYPAPAAIAPAPPAAPLTAAVDVPTQEEAKPAPRSASKLALVGAFSLVAGVGLAVIGSRALTAADVPAPVPVTAGGAAAESGSKPPVAPVAVQGPAVVTADASVAEPPAPVVVNDGDKPVKPEPRVPKAARRVPTTDELQRRIEALRAEYDRLLPSTTSPDPSAHKLLGKYKLQSWAESAAARAKVEQSLNAFERQFLVPLRR